MLVGVAGLEPAAGSGKPLRAASQPIIKKSLRDLGGRGFIHSTKAAKKTTQRWSFLLVGVAGLEPAASWSRTMRATNCATPRCSKQSPIIIFTYRWIVK